METYYWILYRIRKAILFKSYEPLKNMRFKTMNALYIAIMDILFFKNLDGQFSQNRIITCNQFIKNLLHLWYSYLYIEILKYYPLYNIRIKSLVYWSIMYIF